jgi:hypothetical protein
VLVRRPRRLPDAGVVHGQQPVELLAHPRPRQQSLGHRPRAVGERDQGQSGAAQGPDAVGHVVVDVELLHPGHDVLHRGVDVGHPGLRQQRGEHACGDLSEGLRRAGRSEAEAVSQHRCEPGGTQVRGRPDLLEAPVERRHVGQRLVDVEHDHLRLLRHSCSSARRPDIRPLPRTSPRSTSRGR